MSPFLEPEKLVEHRRRNTLHCVLLVAAIGLLTVLSSVLIWSWFGIIVAMARRHLASSRAPSASRVAAGATRWARIAAMPAATASPRKAAAWMIGWLSAMLVMAVAGR